MNGFLETSVKDLFERASLVVTQEVNVSMVVLTVSGIGPSGLPVVFSEYVTPG